MDLQHHGDCVARDAPSNEFYTQELMLWQTGYAVVLQKDSSNSGFAQSQPPFSWAGYERSSPGTRYECKLRPWHTLSCKPRTRTTQAQVHTPQQVHPPCFLKAIPACRGADAVQLPGRHLSRL